MRLIVPTVALLLAAPLAAKDSLGVFGDWGAFRDADPTRCYAIAMAEPSSARRETQPFASVSDWPSRRVRGQLHIRLSRRLQQSPRIQLSIGGRRFAMNGGGSDGWADSAASDAQIVAAMRSAASMSVSATDARGNRFTDRYSLEGAATAIDAASVGCARR